MSVLAPPPPAAPPATPPPAPPPGSARPPAPPRRIPRPPVRRAPMTPGQALLRSALLIAVLLIASFVVDVTVFSQLQQTATQQRLRDAFRAQLAAGTAPVSEADFAGRLIRSSSPVALLDIPQIGVHQVVVEGTDGGTLRAGPGHRRDTPLPGQPGVSVLLGRAAAFGGPFQRIQELAPGDRFTVRTGQGSNLFEVMGVRYAGDPTPSILTKGASRLSLQSARGPAFAPQGIVYVDARLVGRTRDGGARQTTATSLAPQDRAMASDTRQVWALVFALQFLLAASLAAAWARRRVGSRKTWIVGVPVLGLAVLLTADQLVPLLPNLL